MAKKQEERNFGQKLWHYRKEILIGILLILAIIFLVKNSDSVEFNMIFWTADVPLIILLLGWGSLGALIVGIYWLIGNREKKRDIRDLKKRIRELEHELMMAKKNSRQSAEGSSKSDSKDKTAD